MDKFRELEHTADVGLEIYGSTISELFINSVKGLFHLISSRLEKEVVQPRKKFSKNQPKVVIKLSTSNQEELLNYWLNEFIYIFFVKDLFPKIIQITALTKKTIRAEVEFSKRSKEIRLNLEIKAATYHNLSIKKVGNYYQASVIFDV